MIRYEKIRGGLSHGSFGEINKSINIIKYD